MLKIKIAIVSYAVILFSCIAMFLLNTNEHEIHRENQVNSELAATYTLTTFKSLDYYNSFESEAFSEVSNENKDGIITFMQLFVIITLIIFLIKFFVHMSSWSTLISSLVSITITCISFLLFFNICSFFGYNNILLVVIMFIILAVSNIIMFILEFINSDDGFDGIFNVRYSFQIILQENKRFDNAIKQFKLNHKQLLS